jgi:ABC-2 type transport system permease protein
VLWYRMWIDTRWRFLIGLALLLIASCGVVLAYPRAMRVLAALPPGAEIAAGSVSPQLRARLEQAVALARTYRGYIWTQWFSQELPQLWCLLAIALGSGGLVSQAARGGGIFTLSLPVSRSRLVQTRAATALGELLVLSIVPSLLLPMLSPAVGQTYSVAEALVHGTCLFVGGAVFFSTTFLLSSLVEQVWIPPLIMLCTAVVISTARAIEPDLARYTLAPILSAESYFRAGALPWTGLLASAGFSAAALYASTRNIARRDF